MDHLLILRAIISSKPGTHISNIMIDQMLNFLVLVMNEVTVHELPDYFVRAWQTLLQSEGGFTSNNTLSVQAIGIGEAAISNGYFGQLN